MVDPYWVFENYVEAAELLEKYEKALNKIAEFTGSDDPCRGLVQIARDALRKENGNGTI